MKDTLLYINPVLWVLKNIRIPESSFRNLTLKKEESREILKEKEGWIFFFLLKGKCKITLEKKQIFSLKENHCILLPVKEKAMVYARKDSLLILLYLPFYTSFYTHNLTEDYRSLPLCPALQQFFHFTLLLLPDEKIDDIWMELKIREFFLILTIYYSKEELEPFTRLLSPYNSSFRKMVWQAVEEAESISDLLRISGMKRSSFEKKFKKEFGLSPYRFLLQYKAVRVKEALAGSVVSLKEVGRNCGFNSASHFVRFCRRQFGETPRQARIRFLAATPFQHSSL